MTLAFEVFISGDGEIQNDSLTGRQTGDQPPASSLPCVVDGSNALTMWYEIRREQIKGSLSKQLSQIESNLEYSFFDIITERVLDPIVFNF